MNLVSSSTLIYVKHVFLLNNAFFNYILYKQIAGRKED